MFFFNGLFGERSVHFFAFVVMVVNSLVHWTEATAGFTGNLFVVVATFKADVAFVRHFVAKVVLGGVLKTL